MGFFNCSSNKKTCDVIRLIDGIDQLWIGIFVLKIHNGVFHVLVFLVDVCEGFGNASRSVNWYDFAAVNSSIWE